MTSPSCPLSKQLHWIKAVNYVFGEGEVRKRGRDPSETPRYDLGREKILLRGVQPLFFVPLPLIRREGGQRGMGYIEKVREIASPPD
jgi:hypothetical protein